MLAFTHLTSTVGDLFPARELCRRARARGVLTLGDGAQTLGLLDVDLSDMQPDFYTSSAHKWPCGPKEVGLLYVNKSAQARLSPSVVRVMQGAVGFSKAFEGLGQRDEPAIIGFAEALRFQTTRADIVTSCQIGGARVASPVWLPRAPLPPARQSESPWRAIGYRRGPP